MADLINFNRFKKRTQRVQSEKGAAVNRVRFGRTKSERVLEQQRAARATDLIDQHRLDSEDES